jgi:ubiquinone/menaquinone biosynthesis C-methylase UbiE
MKDRAAVIAEHLAFHFVPCQSLLEIGAGKGHVARALQKAAQVEVRLVDVVDYNDTDLPLQVYDGVHLPFPDSCFDYSLLIFVLHHTPDPLSLVREALRVSRGGVVVAENHVQGWLRRQVTRAIDSIPHFQHGVPICYHTHTLDEWHSLFSQLPVDAELLGRFTLDGFWQNFVTRLTPSTPR